MNITLSDATASDAPALAALRTAVAAHLTHDFGRGHWSSAVTETGVLHSLRHSRVFVAREAARIIGTLQLAVKKPWAIDPSYFKNCHRPLYLLGMAVDPSLQRRGLGRAMLEHVRRIARAWPADAVRLDAYDATAGAGLFYAKCGFQEVGRAIYRQVPLIYYELML